jgi:hypothetical protein
MSENLHKSGAGWDRLRANVAARRGIRSSQMEHRPRSAFRAGKPRLPKPEVALEDFGFENDMPPMQPRLRGRRRVVIGGDYDE